MSKIIDLVGKTFGRLHVLSKGQKNGNETLWLCQCNCDAKTKKMVRGTSLRSGNVKSCGCLVKERGRRMLTKHGQSYTKTYGVWGSMRSRCNNPDHQCYYRYGGRGIKVCDRWEKFENFLEDMGEKPNNHSLDRIDNDGHYEPNNCRWANNKMQSRNTSTNTLITYNNKTQTLIEWSEEYNINYKVLIERIYKLKWNLDDALSIPVEKRKFLTKEQIIEIYKTNGTCKFLSEKYNISTSTVNMIKNKQSHKNVTSLL